MYLQISYNIWVVVFVNCEITRIWMVDHICSFSLILSVKILHLKATGFLRILLFNPTVFISLFCHLIRDIVIIFDFFYNIMFSFDIFNYLCCVRFNLNFCFFVCFFYVLDYLYDYLVDFQCDFFDCVVDSRSKHLRRYICTYECFIQFFRVIYENIDRCNNCIVRIVFHFQRFHVNLRYLLEHLDTVCQE